MEHFLSRFLESSRDRGWQVGAAICIGCIFGFLTGFNYDPSGSLLAYTVGGGYMALAASLFLVWVDAARRHREDHPDYPLSLRERFFIALMILGFSIGAVSMLCGCIMGIIHIIESFR
ncbi:MAG TPA: hypothetical protein VF669_03920 [Tepidisphaeraceae bacterium]|jgi:uncharacterized membrane protein YfcA